MQNLTWNEAYTRCLPIIRKYAGRYKNNSTFLNYEDLYSAGLEGLMDAFEKYQGEKNVSFTTYATHRIRGSILDEIRKHQWQTRTFRDKVKELEDFRDRFMQQNNRAPLRVEVEEGLGFSDDDWNKVNHSQQAKILAFPTINQDIQDQEANPEKDLIQHKERSEKLQQAMDELPENMQAVLCMRFIEEHTLKEIAQFLNLSEARIFQLQNSAVKLIKDILGSDDLLAA
jgi:RNA polymerase sigma factor for flagellar operon FliA